MNCPQKMTEETLKELGAGDIPVIYVYNKADRCMEAGTFPVIRRERIYLSARTGQGITELTEMIYQTLAHAAKEKGVPRWT